MAIATFDYATWSIRYPELAPNVSAALAELYFIEAGIYLDNSEASPIIDVALRRVMLNALVAHIASLNGMGPGGASGLVGRVSSATEGSVSVSVADYHTPGSAAWYAQTAYGAAYWAMTAPYRNFAYVPGPIPAARYVDGFYGRGRSWQN